MQFRGITEQEVESVLAAAYLIVPSRSTGNTLYFGRVGTRRIIVAVVPNSQPPHVVTVFD
jgi:hypothetical protein